MKTLEIMVQRVPLRIVVKTMTEINKKISQNIY